METIFLIVVVVFFVFFAINYIYIEFYLLQLLLKRYFLDVEHINVNVKRTPLFDMMISFDNPQSKAIYRQYFRENLFFKAYYVKYFDVFYKAKEESKKEKYIARFSLFPLPFFPVKLEIKKDINSEIIVVGYKELLRLWHH